MKVYGTCSGCGSGAVLNMTIEDWSERPMPNLNVGDPFLYDCPFCGVTRIFFYVQRTCAPPS